MEAASLRDLQAALNRKSSFEMVDHTNGVDQLRVIGRQKGDPMGVNLNNWLLVVKNLLQGQMNAQWKVDISKNYFLRGEHVIYGWRLIFQTPDGSPLEPHIPAIVKAIMTAPHTATGELKEFPLPGYQKGALDRNVSDGRSRGASGTPVMSGARR